METDNLFDFEEEIEHAKKEKLSVFLFQDLEAELFDKILHTDEDLDQTDGVTDLTRHIVEKIKEEFEKFLQNDPEKKGILRTLTKIFTILLSVKAETPEKKFKYCKSRNHSVTKTMVRVKLVPKRTKIRVWPPKEPYQKFKIKVLLPEQKTIQINKNRQPVRTITVKGKTIKFTDRWAKQF